MVLKEVAAVAVLRLWDLQACPEETESPDKTVNPGTLGGTVPMHHLLSAQFTTANGASTAHQVHPDVREDQDPKELPEKRAPMADLLTEATEDGPDPLDHLVMPVKMDAQELQENPGPPDRFTPFQDQRDPQDHPEDLVPLDMTERTADPETQGEMVCPESPATMDQMVSQASPEGKAKTAPTEKREARADAHIAHHPERLQDIKLLLLFPPLQLLSSIGSGLFEPFHHPKLLPSLFIIAATILLATRRDLFTNARPLLLLLLPLPKKSLLPFFFSHHFSY